jgi:hypothetical protein
VRSVLHAPELVAPADPPRWLLLCVASVLVAVAAWALPTSVQAGDAGELSTVMLRGGVPHPSGYPWMRVLGLVARPLESLGMPPATAAALPCALASIAGWLLVLVACARAYGPAPAAFGVLVAATSAPVVLHTHDAEVWGPLVLFAGVVLLLASRPAPAPLLLGLAVGLAVSHHLTAVLLVPIVVGAAWPPAAERASASAFARALARRGGIGLLGAAIGLSAYLTLAIGPDGAWRWGDVRSAGGLVRHVTRADYGTLSLSLHTESVAVIDQWARSIASVGSALGGGLAGGPIFGAIVIAILSAAFAVAPSPAPRPVRIGLAVAALGSLLGLPAAFNLDPASPFAAWILERFDVLGIVLFVPALAAAAALAIGRMPGARARLLLAIAGLALALSSLSHAASRGVPSAQSFVQRYAIDLLRTPPPGTPAIVIGTDDHRTFPVLYAREVLGEGTHVIYIDASLLAHAWYRARLRAEAPWLPDIDQPLRMIGAMWNDPAHRDTPVYLANLFSRPSTQLPRVPEGILWRVIAPHDPPPTQAAVLERHGDAQSRYGAPPPEPGPRADPWTHDLWAAYHEGDARLREVVARSPRTESPSRPR